MDSRYRIQDDGHVIDVRVDRLDQLFDNRDPAPFRQRDLDPDLVEYLTAAGEDLRGGDPIRVAFWLTDPGPCDELEPAYRAHFAYELDRLRRTHRRHRRAGVVALGLALLLLVTSLSLAQLAKNLANESLALALKEGLTIFSWVVLWRPVEILIYDWIPVRRQRSVLRRLRDAPVDLHPGAAQ
jgi:hypothetical protein